MASSGCIVSPPIVSICIRCGWTMGGVKNGYLKDEEAGDQYMGQCNTDKYQLSKRFSLSPAYFGFPHIDDPYQCLSMKQIIKDWI